MKLTVTRAFGDYTEGDSITDDKTVAAILASDNDGNVVRVADDAPVKPAPAPTPL